MEYATFVSIKVTTRDNLRNDRMTGCHSLGKGKAPNTFSFMYSSLILPILWHKSYEGSFFIF